MHSMILLMCELNANICEYIFKQLKDETINEVVKYTFHIQLVASPNCPEHILMYYCNLDKKDDPTSKSKGGEIILFMLKNKNLSSLMLLRIAEKTKRAGTFKEMLNHPNMSKAVYKKIIEQAQSESVKKDAVYAMYKREMIK